MSTEIIEEKPLVRSDWKELFTKNTCEEEDEELMVVSNKFDENEWEW